MRSTASQAEWDEQRETERDTQTQTQRHRNTETTELRGRILASCGGPPRQRHHRPDAATNGVDPAATTHGGSTERRRGAGGVVKPRGGMAGCTYLLYVCTGSLLGTLLGTPHPRAGSVHEALVAVGRHDGPCPRHRGGYLRPGCRIADVPWFLRTRAGSPKIPVTSTTASLLWIADAVSSLDQPLPGPWCGCGYKSGCVVTATMGIDKGGGHSQSILTPTPPCGFAASLLLPPNTTPAH